MASSRRLPSNYNVSTYGDGTRDYTSLDAWESDTDINLVAAGTGEVLDCYDDNSPYDDRLNLSDAEVSSDYFRVVRAAPGQEHKSMPGNGVRIRPTSGNPSLDLKEEYFQLQDLEIEGTNTGDHLIGMSVQEIALVGIIITGSMKSVRCGFDGLGSGEKQYIINCLAYECTTGKGGVWYVYTGSSDADVYFYNVNTIDNDGGFDGYNGRYHLKNCILQGNTSNYSGNNPSSETNVLKDAGVAFADAANDDYHLDSSDTAAKDQGTDLSSDSIYAFDDDIDLETRSGTWDIGADEIVTASSDPSVTSGSASEVTSSSATLNGTLDDLGGESSVEVYFEWGTTTGYGNTTSARTLSATGSFSDSISGLTADQTYHFRAAVTNGVDTWYGSDQSFTATSSEPAAEVVQFFMFPF